MALLTSNTGDSTNRNTLTGIPAASLALQLKGEQTIPFQASLALIADKDSYINDTARSGKRLGAMLMLGEVGEDSPTVLYLIAAGSKPTDPWVYLDNTIQSTPS